MKIDVTDHAKIDRFDVDYKDGKVDSEYGMRLLKATFPTAMSINDMNFVLFSTSGVHGSYTTIEELEEMISKYGDECVPQDEGENAFDLTVLIICPRTVYIRYGNVRVRKDDIAWLKQLRHASHKAIKEIGT